jgi:VanZ family protein
MTRSSLATYVRVVPALLWMSVIFALSSREQFPSPPAVSTSIAAIIAHLVVFGIMATLIQFGLSRPPTFRTVSLAFALTIMYALSDELHQSFVPGRNASAFDILVDAVGGTLALMAYTRSLGRSAASART